MSTHITTTLLNRTIPLAEETNIDQYTERITFYRILVRWLGISLLLALVTITLMGAMGWKMTKEFAERKPLVIRINDVGQAQAVSYASAEYHPEENEIRYFLQSFIQDNDSRDRHTIADSFSRKLYFLDSMLSHQVIDRERTYPTIKPFMTSSDDNISVEVQNVAIDDLQKQPYKATIYYTRVYHAFNDAHETKRERVIAHCQFAILNSVPANFIPVNPLGLVITYFREDTAF